MLSDDILEQARTKLTLGPLVPDDDELMARYLGTFTSYSEVVKSLFQSDSPHIDVAAWPYAHIDWDAASEALGRRDVLEVDGHWFDALAAKPPVAA
jgi:hypothetical protein